jgi:hypothetical protein
MKSGSQHKVARSSSSCALQLELSRKAGNPSNEMALSHAKQQAVLGVGSPSTGVHIWGFIHRWFMDQPLLTGRCQRLGYMVYPNEWNGDVHWEPDRGLDHKVSLVRKMLLSVCMSEAPVGQFF